VNGIISYFFNGKSIKAFERTIKENGFGQGLKKWAHRTFLISLGGFFAGIFTGIFTNQPDLYITCFGFFGFSITFFSAYFFEIMKSEKRKKEIEELVPDALLHAASFPAGTTIEKIISELGKSGFGKLSEEFSRAEKEISKGVSVEQALQNISHRNNSQGLKRAIKLLIQQCEDGGDMVEAFRETAGDIIETRNIIKERASAMIIEKYTLLFAGGLIVPLVLGLLVKMVNGLDFGEMAFFESSISQSERRALLDAALLANQIYIMEYAVLASVFVANQENDIKKAVLYSAFLLPLGLTAYFSAQFFL
jgi:Flp pilus assembly protein TadB